MHRSIKAVALVLGALIDAFSIWYVWWLLGTRDYIVPQIEFTPLFAGLILAAVIGYAVLRVGSRSYRWIGLLVMMPPILIFGLILWDRLK